MKKAVKRVLALFLALVMTFGAAPLGGLAGLDLHLPSLFEQKASADTSEIYTYSVTDGKATITKCDSSASGAITIPSTLGDYPVTSIGDYAFYKCTGLTSITIPDSVTSIGDYAFYECTGLTSITIPNSVTSIGGNAFYHCSKLTSVTIPDSVTSIGYQAFYRCTSLTSITISNSVTSIRYGAFEYTGYYNNTSNWENDVLYIGKYLIKAKDTISGAYTIKSGTTVIAVLAFSGCTGLTSVTIPDSVTSIGQEAFQNTGYYNNTSNWENDVLYIGKYLIKAKDTISGAYTIKAGTTVIADDAFNGCTGLTSVTIGNSVTSIGDSAFSGCTGLTSVTIGNSVTSIGKDAFYNTGYYNNTSNWENNVLYIGKYLIKAKDTISGAYTIKSGTTVIADYAFPFCNNLTSVTIPDSVTNIGEGAFCYCTGLTSVTIPDSVTSIGAQAFDGCRGLTSVTIPDSVTSIGVWVFSNCTNLEYVHIPSSVTSIGESILDDTTAYICSDTDTCYAKTYADANGITFKVCSGHANPAEEYTVTYYADGTQVAKDSFDYGAAVNETAVVPTKEGSAFTGWQWYDAQHNPISKPATMPAGNLTAEAKFSSVGYTATFDANGGTFADGTTASKTVTGAYNSTLNAPAVPPRKAAPSTAGRLLCPKQCLRRI